MTTVFRLNQFDISWTAKLASRRAILWLGSESKRLLENANVDLSHLIEHPWAAVYDDRSGFDLSRYADCELAPRFVFRLFSTVPAEQLPPNRIPIYSLPEDGGGVRGKAARFQLIDAAPAGCDVFAFGVGGDAVGSFREAVELNENLRNIVVLGGSETAASRLADVAERLSLYAPEASSSIDWLDDGTRSVAADLAIYLRDQGGKSEVIDISRCVDSSDPITAQFDIVPAFEALRRDDPTFGDIMTLLEDPCLSWRPYATGAAFPRSEPYYRQVRTQLKAIRTAGSSGGRAIVLPVEPGSGATTLLRDIVFKVARDGLPAMVARAGANGFDVNQLAQFMTRVSDLIADKNLSVPDLPWLICFDVDHQEREHEFVSRLSSALQKLLKPALVLVCASDRLTTTAAGSRKTMLILEPALANAVNQSEALALGSHLGSLLPPELKRNASEWRSFVDDSARSSPEGPRSLFWVALRFWLLRANATAEPLRGWLSTKLTLVAGESPIARATLLEIATVARSRLDIPLSILLAEGRLWLRGAEEKAAKAIGLVIHRHSTEVAVTISHPLMAEEILRIALGRADFLEAVGAVDSGSLLDLELVVLGRILPRQEVGSSAEGIGLVQELATSSLRIDPRHAPRTWEQREQIVRLLESVPNGVWDGSQVFNHHIAIARRHLANDPQNPRWGITERIDQLALAENHLLDILENLGHLPEERKERSLNLHVTYALTADARAILESQAGNDEEALRYGSIAASQYRHAEREDADNSYVLENFARHKLRLARDCDAEERWALIVEAIQLLQRERIGDGAAAREHQVLQELANAYELLAEGSGEQMLWRSASLGNESAGAALAWMRLDRAGWPNVSKEHLQNALSLLDSVKVSAATGRSLELRYLVQSRLSPYDFRLRTELLEALVVDDNFAWPLQFELEFAVLLFQVGDSLGRRRGYDLFRSLRRSLPVRFGHITVPEELRFLRDPTTGFQKPLRMTMVASSRSEYGKNRGARIQGWGDIEVRFRDISFGSEIAPGGERDCFIEFSNFGPQAVPTTTAVSA